VGGSGLGAEAGETAEEAMRFAQMDADGGGSVSFAELVRLRPLLTTRYSLLATRHSPLLTIPTYYSLLATHNLLGALPAAANRPGGAHAARLQRACGGAGARRAYGSAPEGGKLNVTRRAHSSCSPLHVTANA
jgi:hypothetical protein